MCSILTNMLIQLISFFKMKSISPEVQSTTSLKLRYLYKIQRSAFETHCLPRLHSGNIFEPWWKLPNTLFLTSLLLQAEITPFCCFFLLLEQEGNIYLFGIFVSILRTKFPHDIDTLTIHISTCPSLFLMFIRKNNCSSTMSLSFIKFASIESSSPECSSPCVFHLP